MRRVKSIFLAVVMIGSAPAHAGDVGMWLASSYGSSVFQQGVIAMGKPTLEAGQRSVLGKGDDTSPADPSAEQLASLQFDFSEPVSRRVRAELVERIVADIGASAPRERIETLFNSGQVWRTFDSLLSDQGYSSANLADVMMAYYVGTWEIINDQDAAKVRGGKQGVKAVRDRLAAALAASPTIQRMTDAAKQETAETLGHVLVVAAAARQSAVQSGSEQDLQTIRSRVHESLLAQGIDMRKLQLTADGFEPAS